jgi:hypothetical protein
LAFSLKHWSKLHAFDAAALRQRWSSNPDPKYDEALLDGNRFSAAGVWTVKTEIEMVRLVGALQWQNPRMALWFRGENAYFPKALPARFRISRAKAAATGRGIAWLDKHAARDRALRDRSPLARAAILQHYGCPTSLLDLTSSYDVACAFAFESAARGQAHLRVYALPRHQHAVSVFDDADIVLVDLNAELPSYCARPHVQQAAFIARREAVHSDITGAARVRQSLGDVDAFCIAHIRLNFDGAKRFYIPRKAAEVLYPRAGTQCSTCGTRPDMNGDYLLHILRCYAERFPRGKPPDFPDQFSPP